MNDPNSGKDLNFVGKLNNQRPRPPGQEGNNLNYGGNPYPPQPVGPIFNYLPSQFPSPGSSVINPYLGNQFLGPPIGRPQVQQQVEPGAMNFSKEDLDYWFTLNEQQKLYLITTQTKFAKLNMYLTQYHMRGGIPPFRQVPFPSTQPAHQPSPEGQSPVINVAAGSSGAGSNHLYTSIPPPVRPSPPFRTEVPQPLPSQNVAYNFQNNGYNPQLRTEATRPPPVMNAAQNLQSQLSQVQWNAGVTAQLQALVQANINAPAQQNPNNNPQAYARPHTQVRSSEPIDLTSEEEPRHNNLMPSGPSPATGTSLPQQASDGTQDPVPRNPSLVPEGATGSTPVSSTPAGSAADMGASDGKRKFIDGDGNEHLYPASKRQESIKDRSNVQFSKSSRQHLSVLVRLSSLYTQKLNALGSQPLIKSDSGELIPDEGWEAQHRGCLVSALFCLETATRFMEKLRNDPKGYAVLSMDPMHGDKLEVQMRIKLSMLLLNHTCSHRRAEYHLTQALSLSQKNFSPKEQSYGVRLQLANLYIQIGHAKHAETILRSCINEAQSLGFKDWGYAMNFQLTNLPRSTQPIEILAKLHAMATASGDYGIMAVISLKTVLHHLKQQNLVTLQSQLPQLKEWFELSSDPHVIVLKPYIYLLDTLRMVMSGDFTNRKELIASFNALTESWVSLPEEPEFHFKLSLAAESSNPAEVRFCWMSRRQVLALVYFVSGLLIKPTTNAPMGAKSICHSVECAITNFNHVPAGNFIPGFIQRRQSYYVNLIILCRLHLSDFFIVRENFQNARQVIQSVVDICTRNGLWEKFAPFVLHAKGLLAQAQSQFDASFMYYRAALKLPSDPSLKLAIAFNLLMLAIKDQTNPNQKLSNVFESIQAACPEPRLVPVECVMWLLSAIFSNTMLTRKKNFSRAFSLSNLSLNDQAISLLNILSGVMFFATNTATADKILNQVLKSQQKFNLDIGSITASTLLCKLSELRGDQAAGNVNKSILDTCLASYKEKCKQGN